MEGLKKFSKRLEIKDKTSGPFGGGTDGYPRGVMNETGGVGAIGFCGHYGEELDKLGNCRDSDCRYQRLIKAFYNGEAMKLKNGNIVWTPGFKIRRDK